MTALLYLGHAAIAAFLLLASRGDPESRARAGVAGGAVGLLLGLVLVAAGSAVPPWRSAVGLPGTSVVAGAAITAAWLLALVLGEPSERWRSGALVGVGAAGFALFSFNRWIVPALLFWICSSVAIALLTSSSQGRGHVWVALGLSDLALAAALAGRVAEADSWALSEGLSGWPLWAVAGCMVIRAGVVPAGGVWAALRSPAACGLPLLVGGAFVLASRSISNARPWIALALVVFSLGLGLWAARGDSLAPSAVAAWPMGVLLGLCFVSPRLAPIAGVAAVAAAGAAGLWRFSGSRGRVARGVILSLAPVTAGFSAVIAGAVISFERASSAATLADAAPWTALAATLPLILALGIFVGVVVARQGEVHLEEAVSGGWTWILAWGALGAGLLHQALGRPMAEAIRIVTLYVAAAAAGAVASAAARLGNSAREPADPALLVTLDEEDDFPSTPAPAFAALAMVPALLTALLLTLAGLKVGFL